MITSKMRDFTTLTAIILVAVLITAPVANATNGYFSSGYGTAYKGLAGAGVALSLSTLGAATNPASMVGLGNRYDLSVAYFNPNRNFTVDGNPSGFPGTFGLAPGNVESSSTTFIIPSLGFNRMLNETSSFGLSIYGNGGMNTDYETSVFLGTSPTGVDFAQLFIQPTYAIKLTSQHSVGAGVILAYQRFRAEGLEAFAGFSTDAANLTGNDHSTSIGVGFKVGYLGELSEMLSVGASYQLKTAMSEFDEYAGLFAEQGDFDVPATWTAGVALSPNDELTLVADVQQILYSGVASISNPFLQFDPATGAPTNPLGADNGAGFGWEDMTIIKIGIQYVMDESLTLRGGFSFGGQPIPDGNDSRDLIFNILAPGVVETHISVGATKTMNNGHAVSLAVTRALSNSISGPNPLEAPSQQTITLEMDQWEVEVGYSF